MFSWSNLMYNTTLPSRKKSHSILLMISFFIPILLLLIMPVYYNVKYWSRGEEIVGEHFSFFFLGCGEAKCRLKKIVENWRIKFNWFAAATVSNETCVICYSWCSCGHKINSRWSSLNNKVHAMTRNLSQETVQWEIYLKQYNMLHKLRVIIVIHRVFSLGSFVNFFRYSEKENRQTGKEEFTFEVGPGQNLWPSP